MIKKEYITAVRQRYSQIFENVYLNEFLAENNYFYEYGYFVNQSDMIASGIIVRDVYSGNDLTTGKFDNTTFAFSDIQIGYKSDETPQNTLCFLWLILNEILLLKFTSITDLILCQVR